jgi:hypothetical protein
MSMTNEQDVIDSVARTGQFIGIGLITGAVGIIGVSIAVDPTGGAPRPAMGTMDVGEIITWLAFAFAAISLPLSVIVPGQIARQNRQQIAKGTWTASQSGQTHPGSPFGPEALKSDAAKLALVYQIQFIVGAALNEGPTFLAAVAYMIGRNPITVGLACLLVVALAARFPTRDRVASWIDRQQELLIEDRQAAF